MIFSDLQPVLDKESLHVTKDGYLAAVARVARGGNVQVYSGAEMGKPELDSVRVFRPDSEVFHKGTMQSFAHRPLTNDHPDQMVNSDNWREHAVGYSGDDIARDGEYIRVPLLLTDQATISDFKSGKRQLSMGYTADIEWADGITPSGLEYDAIQRNIRNNHIALVDRARAGEGARIGDGGSPTIEPVAKPHHEDTHMTEKTRTVVIDGLSIETTEQGAQVIDKLQQQIADAKAATDKAEASHKEALAAKDKELATKDAEIKKLTDSQMTAEAMDKAIADRADLIAKAKTIADADYSGKSESDIRKTAVVAVLGDEAIKDKSDAYIDARFDVLIEDAESTDPVRNELKDRRDNHKDADNGQSAYEKRLADGWKQTKGAA